MAPTPIDTGVQLLRNGRFWDPHLRPFSRRDVLLRRRWRRSQELHHVRVPEQTEVLHALRSAGFVATASRAYGRAPMMPGRAAFIARKPKRSGRRLPGVFANPELSRRTEQTK